MTEPWQSRGEYDRAMAVSFAKKTRGQNNSRVWLSISRPWQSLTEQRGQSNSRLWLCVVYRPTVEQG